MKHPLPLVWLLLLLCFYSCSDNGEETVPPPPGIDIFQSFLDEVLALPDSLRPAKVDSFMTWVEDSASFPLSYDTVAVFLHRGSFQSISVPGDFNGWNPNSDAMTMLEGTNLWYVRKIFEPDARLDYKFVTDGSNWILDPRNPRQVLGGFGPNSELAMPGYVDPPEIVYDADIPHGTKLQFNFQSDILQNTRPVTVYTPPGYSSSAPSYPCLYVHDGGEYISLASMDNVLDYLIYHNEIEPIVVFFVDPVNRNSEYFANEAFLNMVVNELVPYFEGQFNITADPHKRGTMGASLGGLVSLDLGYSFPDVFGIVIGQSSAIQHDPALAEDYETGDVHDISIYLDWGTYEGGLASANESFIQVLEEKGYPLLYGVYPEGHSWGNWRAHIDEALKHFYPKQ